MDDSPRKRGEAVSFTHDYRGTVKNVTVLTLDREWAQSDEVNDFVHLFRLLLMMLRIKCVAVDETR